MINFGFCFMHVQVKLCCTSLTLSSTSSRFCTLRAERSFEVFGSRVSSSSSWSISLSIIMSFVMLRRSGWDRAEYRFDLRCCLEQSNFMSNLQKMRRPSHMNDGSSSPEWFLSQGTDPNFALELHCLSLFQNIPFYTKLST